MVPKSQGEVQEGGSPLGPEPEMLLSSYVREEEGGYVRWRVVESEMRAGGREVDREEREDGQNGRDWQRGNVERRNAGSFRPFFPGQLETISTGDGGGIKRRGGDRLREGRSRFAEEEVGRRRGRGGNGRQKEAGRWVALSKRDSRHFCRACVQGYRMHQAHRGEDR